MEIKECDKNKEFKGVSSPKIYRMLLKMGYGKDCVDAKIDKRRQPHGTMLIFKTSDEFWRDYLELLVLNEKKNLGSDSDWQ